MMRTRMVPGHIATPTEIIAALLISRARRRWPESIYFGKSVSPTKVSVEPLCWPAIIIFAGYGVVVDHLRLNGVSIYRQVLLSRTQGFQRSKYAFIHITRARVVERDHHVTASVPSAFAYQIRFQVR